METERKSGRRTRPTVVEEVIAHIRGLGVDSVSSEEEEIVALSHWTWVEATKAAHPPIAMWTKKDQKDCDYAWRDWLVGRYVSNLGKR